MMFLHRMAPASSLACVAFLLLTILVICLLTEAIAVQDKRNSGKNQGVIIAAVKPGDKKDNYTMATTYQYVIYDQCNPISGDNTLDDGNSDEHKIRSSRMQFYCARGKSFTQNCSSARLLVCHPSKLNPRAFPSEAYKDMVSKKNVLTRAGASISLRINNESEITNNCTRLMKECMKDKECKDTMTEVGQVEGEIWHGFLVQRNDNNFVLELPYGTPNFEVKLPEGSESFLFNFGNADDSENTYIEYHDKDENAWKECLGEGPETEKCSIENSEKRHEKYMQEFPTEGMQAHRQRHLWLLGLDILPPDGQDRIRFYTQGFPSTVVKPVCQQKQDGLDVGNETVQGFVNAKYYAPKDMETRLIELKERQTGVEKLSVGKIIKVSERVNGFSQRMEHFLVKSTFFINGRVLPHAKSIKIMILLGTERPDEILGEQILEIMIADNKKDEDLECTLKFFPSEENYSCNSDGNSGFQKGKIFWIWVKIEEGMVHLSLHCLTKTFVWEKPLYSLDNHIYFEGDIELKVSVTKEEGSDNVLLYEKGKPIYDTGGETRKPALIVQKFPDGKILNENILLLNRYMIDKEFKHIELAFVSTATQSKMAAQIYVDDVKGNCSAPAICHCINFTSGSSKIEEPPVPVRSCSENINLIFFFRDFGPNESFLIYQYLNGKKTSIEITIENGENERAFDYLQLKGDTVMRNENLFELYMKNEKNSPNYTGSVPKMLMQRKDYVIIYGLVLDSKKVDGKLNFDVKLSCLLQDTCYWEIPYDGTTLSINFDMVAKCTTIESYKRDEDYKRILNKGISCDAKKNDKWPITIGKPFWLKILANATDSKFHIYVDGMLYSEIEYVTVERQIENPNRTLSNILVSNIQVEGDNNAIHVLNSLQFFPYRKMLKENNANFAQNTNITFAVQFLENSTFSEFLLVKGKSSEEMELFGTDELKEFGGIVYIHIKTLDKDHYCISNEFNPSKTSCKDPIENHFSPGITFIIDITLKEKELVLRIRDHFKVIKEREPDRLKNSPLEATHLVLAGDIALMSEPTISPQPVGTTKVVNSTTSIPTTTLPQSEK